MSLSVKYQGNRADFFYMRAFKACVPKIEKW